MLERARITRAQRELRALAREVAQDDPEALGAFVALLDQARDEFLQDAAALQHDRGYSWAEIGRGLGITRQSAQERFGRKAAQTGA